jgi:precorrin-2 dehydrogenase / sirohydrochlorin ferrochelatase
LLPLVLDPANSKVGLAGSGPALERRRAVLADAGIVPVPVALDASEAFLGLRVLLIAGVDREAAAALAGRAKGAGLLVNVEDEPSLCDFHVPAIVRRGDLLLTVSSAGRSPGLVRIVREWLEEHFGPQWAGRVGEASERRVDWRGAGLPPEEISKRTRALVEQNGWLS